METTTLLKGNIKKELISLALPLLLCNILQQLYNTADSFIIACFLGNKAFASTGISGTLMNLFIFVLNGFCVGISVIFSQVYGADNKKLFRQNFFLAIMTGAILTVLFSFLAVCFLEPLLLIIRTPADLAGYCKTYMTIILAGLLATYFYNFFAGILRSIGNTTISLYFLLLALLVNIVLDLLFVAVLGIGIAGAAYATVAAQLLSALSCFIYLQKKYPDLLCHKNDVCFQFPLFTRILRFGLISALHQSSLYIGKIMVQGAVNTLGTDGIAAYTATMRIEGMTNSFGDSGSQAISVFISQNYGAGNSERVTKGLKEGLALLVLLGCTISGIMYVSSPAFLTVFLGHANPVSMEYGISYLHIIALFYVLCFIGNAFVGYFRGIGKVMIPFLGTTFHLTLRVILSWYLIAQFGLSAVAIATGAGWVLIVCYYIAAALINRTVF